MANINSATQTLSKQIEFYKDHQDEFLKNYNENILLTHNEKLIQVFEDRVSVYKYGIYNF